MRILFLLPVVPMALHAQDILDPLIVTASRTETAESDTPYTVERIDAIFLQENTRRTLPEALQFTPGVLVQKTAYGHGSPYLRGFTGRQNLLMVDGVRVNNSVWRSGPVQYWNTIDPYSIVAMATTPTSGGWKAPSGSAGNTA